MQTRNELIKEIKTIALSFVNDMPHWADTVGIRYDEKEIVVGEELENSSDTRDDETGCLDGTCAYQLAVLCDDIDDIDDRALENVEGIVGQAKIGGHCSIVIGVANHDEIWNDEGEVVLTQCEVAKVLW